MILRDFACSVCGAPRRTTESALVVFCAHCGAILTFSGDGQWKPTAFLERHEAGLQQLVKPNAAQARLMALTTEMYSALAADQRERWRALAEEQVIVMAIAYPQNGIPMPTDPAARARHVAAAVVMSELTTFDPRVSGTMGRFSAAAASMMSGDAVASARNMLAAAKDYYAAIAAHPQLPPGTLKESPDHLAKELVRSSISGYASLLGASTIERIRVEVLGDKTERACPKCGSPIQTTGLARCPHCGAVTDIDVDDSWTNAQLALWQLSKADLVRRNQLDGITPVITAVGGFIHTAARDVPPEKAMAYLQRAIPWVTPADFVQGLDLLAPGVNPEARLLLGALRNMPWRCDPSQRPGPHLARTDFSPPTPAEEAAWIEAALGLWNYRRGALLDMLGQPLSALQVAAMHEQPAGVSARAAMQFFDRAWPGYDRRAMREQVMKLAPGYDHPRLRAFTTELVGLLGW